MLNPFSSVENKEKYKTRNSFIKKWDDTARYHPTTIKRDYTTYLELIVRCTLDALYQG